MKSRGIVGKRIVAVRQSHFWNENIRTMDIDVIAIVLEDGTELRPVVSETGCEYAVDFIVVKSRR